MPEIVEVRKYCDFINENMMNQNITNISILNGRYKKHKPFEGYHMIKKYLPLKFIKAQSKGKFIYITFENNIILFCTLGLSGGWTFLSDKKYLFPNIVEYLNINDIKQYHDKSLKHLNVEFKIATGSLYFFDMLSFGTLKAIDNIITLEKKLKSIAPDVMECNKKTFNDIIRCHPSKMIGLVLLNQKIISGIGNYLRADVLWMAKVSPFRYIKNITPKEINKIYRAIMALTWGNYDIKFAIKNKLVLKSTRLPFFYKRDFYIYNETNDIYGNHVKKEELYEGSQKRFIYWCPSYQK